MGHHRAGVRRILAGQVSGRPAAAGAGNVVSVNVGLPREVEAQGTIVLTSIFKAPVSGPVRVGLLNLDGDRQSDLSVHGGAHKAVYVYPAEHYAFWRGELPDTALPWGAFGENLTTEGLREDATCVGDRFRIGSAEFVVTQPRMPCFKLGIRFGRPDIVKRFLGSGRTGFYLRVSQEGAVQAGDAVTLVSRDDGALTVTDLVALYTDDTPDHDLLRRASELQTLPGGWRAHFRKRLSQPHV
jgi:MOSC domain-containing protein YiiM